jgi:hypothetical protein
MVASEFIKAGAPDESTIIKTIKHGTDVPLFDVVLGCIDSCSEYGNGEGCVGVAVRTTAATVQFAWDGNGDVNAIECNLLDSVQSIVSSTSINPGVPGMVYLTFGNGKTPDTTNTPTVAPTPSPTPSPTLSPTPEPTPPPPPTPTQSPTPAPTPAPTPTVVGEPACFGPKKVGRIVYQFDPGTFFVGGEANRREQAVDIDACKAKCTTTNGCIAVQYRFGDEKQFCNIIKEYNAKKGIAKKAWWELYFVEPC